MKMTYEILIDFDGTCVKHDFPNIGEDIGAIPVLQDLVYAGNRLILFTMRSNRVIFNPSKNKDVITIDNEGNFLNNAINWFIENNIELYGVQKNPTQNSWTESPKAYGQFMIDDTAIGCPLIEKFGERPYVDWGKMRKLLDKKGVPMERPLGME